MKRLMIPPYEYVSPKVEVLEVEVEQGFAQSYGREGLPGLPFEDLPGFGTF